MGESVTRMWRDYEHGVKYLADVGLARKIPMCVRFYEGDQWPKATNTTKNLPRPVVNFVKMICRNKKAAILATPVRIRYHTDREGADVTRFNRFAEYMGKKIGLERLYMRAMNDGTVKGTYCMHFYWDAEAEGWDGSASGALKAECIDMLHLFVENPVETDEQKQKWIMISSRESVAAVRAKADDDVNRDDIVADEKDVRTDKSVEQDGDGMVTVLTRYFRIDGEVYCEIATKSVTIKKPFPIAPDVEGELRRMRGEDDEGDPEDAAVDAMPDDTEGRERRQVRASLYPLVIGQYDEREGSIYGLGEAEGLIANQREVNFNFAMVLLNAQVNAWGKYVVDPAALRDQSITNEPGQVLVDYSGTGNGIRNLAAQRLSSQPLSAAEAVIQLTRSVSGATEVMTGETVGSNMSGAAIAQLQSQARQPVVDLRNKFWLSVERVGLVLAQFYKLFYEAEEFSYDERTEGAEEMLKKTGTFYSDDYRDVSFSVVVEATQGTNSSSAGDITALDMLLQRQLIDVETYIRAYPSDALSNKEELLEGIKNAKADELSALREKVAQYEKQLSDAAELLARQNQTVDNVTSVISENKNLKALLAALFAESEQKLGAAHAAIEAEKMRYDEVYSDAETFAAALGEQMKGAEPMPAT